MHSKSGNMEVMINDEADEIVKELSKSFKNRYQNNLELMKSSQFVFDYVHLLYYKSHKINPSCGGSCLDSPYQVKKKAVYEDIFQVILLKKLLALLRGITSKNHRDFYCLNCFHPFTTEYMLKSHKKVCENKDFCNVVMPSEDSKILEFNKYQKFDEAPKLLFIHILNV